MNKHEALVLYIFEYLERKKHNYTPLMFLKCHSSALEMFVCRA
jgi:hypothetical protein